MLLDGAVETNLVTVPNVPTNLPSDVPGSGAILSVWKILALLLPFIGGARALAPVVGARNEGVKRAAGFRRRGFSRAYYW